MCFTVPNDECLPIAGTTIATAVQPLASLTKLRAKPKRGSRRLPSRNRPGGGTDDAPNTKEDLEDQEDTVKATPPTTAALIAEDSDEDDDAFGFSAVAASSAAKPTPSVETAVAVPKTTGGTAFLDGEDDIFGENTVPTATTSKKPPKKKSPKKKVTDGGDEDDIFSGNTTAAAKRSAKPKGKSGDGGKKKEKEKKKEKKKPVKKLDDDIFGEDDGEYPVKSALFLVAVMSWIWESFFRAQFFWLRFSHRKNSNENGATVNREILISPFVFTNVLTRCCTDTWSEVLSLLLSPFQMISSRDLYWGYYYWLGRRVYTLDVC